MAIEISGRLVAWLATRGYLGESTDYWRTQLNGPGPKGGKHPNQKVPRLLYVPQWVPEAEELLDGFRTALGKKPRTLKFNSVTPAQRALAQLEALRRSFHVKNNSA